MKTQMTLTQNNFSLKKLMKSVSLIGIFMMALLISNPIYAQTDKASSSEDLAVKGVVNDEFGNPLEANITLKGTQVGTSADKDGAFTFPKELKKNDVLVFTHLGFNTTEIKIDEKHPFIEVTMGTEVIEMSGALAVDKPYKSKRKE